MVKLEKETGSRSLCNRLFTSGQLAVLLRPERWRIIAPWQIATSKGKKRQMAWYARHTQVHSHREVLIGLAGKTFYGIGEGMVEVGAGTVVMFESMARHQAGYPPFEPDIEHLWISLLRENFTARVLKIHGGKLATLASASLLFGAEEIGMALTPKALGQEPVKGVPLQVRAMRLRAVVTAMVAELIERGYATDYGQSPTADQSRLMATIQQHLLETAGRGDSVSSLARIAGCSPFHFMRLFKCHTGHTVLGFVNLCRRKKADELRAHGLSQKEIGYALGFSCPQTFSRWDQRHGAMRKPAGRAAEGG